MVQSWQPLFLPNCTGKVRDEASPDSEMWKRTSSLNKEGVTDHFTRGEDTEREVGNREPFCNLPLRTVFCHCKSPPP